MIQLRSVRSADLAGAEREALRRLVLDAFMERFIEDDWDHTVGGWHILSLDGGEVVAHAGVVTRTLVASSRPFDTGYVDGIAVWRDHGRRGHARHVMREANRITAGRYQPGALSDGERHPGFYQRLGWQRWQGPTFVASPRGPIRTAEDDGSVSVRRTPATGDLDLTAPLMCYWRSGDVW